MGVVSKADVDRVTRLLCGARSLPASERRALEAEVYAQLQRLAHGLGKPPASPLQTTGLVHEAWLRLAPRGEWRDRGHFYGVAAAAMRSILIDHLRAGQARKRGGDRERVEQEIEAPSDSARKDLVLDLDHALEELAQVNESFARVAELRLFLTLSSEEIGELLGTSSRTVERRWRGARSWLARRLFDREVEAECE